MPLHRRHRHSNTSRIHLLVNVAEPRSPTLVYRREIRTFALPLVFIITIIITTIIISIIIRFIIVITRFIIITIRSADLPQRLKKLLNYSSSSKKMMTTIKSTFKVAVIMI